MKKELLKVLSDGPIDQISENNNQPAQIKNK